MKSVDSLCRLVQAEMIRPGSTDNSKGDRLQLKDVAVYAAEWSPKSALRYQNSSLYSLRTLCQTITLLVSLGLTRR